MGLFIVAVLVFSVYSWGWFLFLGSNNLVDVLVYGMTPDARKHTAHMRPAHGYVLEDAQRRRKGQPRWAQQQQAQSEVPPEVLEGPKAWEVQDAMAEYPCTNYTPVTCTKFRLRSAKHPLIRNAREEDLKKAYKRLARIWHPDKNPVKKAEVEGNFNRISEAYDVLSDPQKRQIYDLYGEEALKSGQVPPPPHSSSSSFSRAFHHHRQNPPPSFHFNPRDADDIYAELFGSNDSSAASSRRDAFFRTSNGTSSSSSSVATFSSRKATPVENALPCSLEDLYKGVKKKMKISRKRTTQKSSSSRTFSDCLTSSFAPPPSPRFIKWIGKNPKPKPVDSNSDSGNAKSDKVDGDISMCPPPRLGQFYDFFSFSHLTPPLQSDGVDNINPEHSSKPIDLDFIKYSGSSGEPKQIRSCHGFTSLES
ncbi:hypothetical protein Fmac_026586 [Flemingia macrophylla]|uniref:J domain-containing protein n=1 Tax=Flemingia macrophylla TaxID=520843 RepID=A0ABD1LFB3_9FABA